MFILSPDKKLFDNETILTIGESSRYVMKPNVRTEVFYTKQFFHNLVAISLIITKHSHPTIEGHKKLCEFSGINA